MKGLKKAGKIALAVSVVFSLAVSPVMADPPAGRGKPGKGQKHKKHDRRKKDDTLAVSLVYAGITAEQARRWARDYRYTGYKALPPGVAKNLARGKPLPPGIAKKAVPPDMLRHLPRHAGYEWRMAGTDLILVAMATGVVADVLSGVFR